jgi:ATP:cob(I)alamin adenosyltransferase
MRGARQGKSRCVETLVRATRSSLLQRLRSVLIEIQSRLMDVCSCIATPPTASSEAKLTRVALPPNLTSQLEALIDEFEEQLPPLKNFILPGGSRASSCLHIARTVCRRLERLLATLVSGLVVLFQCLLSWFPSFFRMQTDLTLPSSHTSIDSQTSCL